MQGPSRVALAAATQELSSLAMAAGSPAALADELYAVARLLDSSPSLRRALADPSADVDAKTALASQLLSAKVSAPALQVVLLAIRQRWGADRDLADALTTLGDETLLVAAEQRGDLVAVAEQVFLFSRTLDANPTLRSALTDAGAPEGARTQLVSRLLTGRAHPETHRLVERAVSHPRGRRLEDVLGEQLDAADARLRTLSATVFSAIPLDADQRRRLQSSLSATYGRSVSTNVVIDPSVMGGLRVEIGDEVIDGSVAAKLDDARRRLVG